MEDESDEICSPAAGDADTAGGNEPILTCAGTNEWTESEKDSMRNRYKQFIMAVKMMAFILLFNLLGCRGGVLIALIEGIH